VSVDVDIANILGISVRTVRSYLDRIRDKTGERRRPGLTMIAIKKGLVPEPQEI
jgi:DNA-binding CsgD family transcriptional regulator